MAIEMLRTLADEPEAGVALVLNALRRTLMDDREPADEDEQARQVAREAFDFFCSESDKTSRGAYDKWRKGHPLMAELPPSSQLRRLLGGPNQDWEQVKRSVGAAPAYDPAALRLSQANSAVQLREVVEPLDEWLRQTSGIVRMDDFLSWYREELTRDDHGWRRLVPLTKNGIYANGGWVKLVTDRGQAGRLASVIKQQNAQAGGRPRRPRRSPPTRDDIREQVTAAWMALGAREYMTAKGFERWGQALRADERRRGLPQSRVVTVDEVREEYGVWSFALLEAGLIDPRTAAKRGGYGHALTNDERYEAVARAMFDRGITLTRDEYEEFCDGRREKAAERGAFLHLPSEGSVRMHLGGPGARWTYARTATLRWIKRTGFSTPAGFQVPVILIKDRYFA